MSLVDRAIEGLPPAAPWMHFQAPLNEESIALSVPDAIVTVVVASVWADETPTAEEAKRVADVLSTSRLLQRASQGGDSEAVARAAGLLAMHGRGPVLAACAAAIPPDMRAPTFANAVDVVFADGLVDEREKTYIDELQRVLGVDDLPAMKIVEVMAIKNRM